MAGEHYPNTPSIPEALLLREIQSLTDRGLHVKLFDGVVEATDPVSGQKWQFSMEMLKPRRSTFTGLPTLTIDLRTIDTNLYNWRFLHVNSVPISGEWGFPLQIGDVDSNGRHEAYGVYQTQASYFARIYEQGPLNTWVARHQYGENAGLVDMQADIDRNGLTEIYLRFGDSLFVFEQVQPDSLPIGTKFRHRQWYQSATGIPNQIEDMNNDGNEEILYRGSRLDSAGQPNVEKTFIMRYNQGVNDLEEVWSKQLPPDCQSEGCSGAIATGDFDGDGKTEFVTSNFAGNMYVVERTIEDSFEVTWSMNLSAAGRVTSGDVDNNGAIEFLIGGTQVEEDGYVHLRAYAFERTGDNEFQPMFAFNIFPAGMFFVDLYQTADVDGDGTPELILSCAGGIIVIRAAEEHVYELFYYQPPFALDGVAARKINGNQQAHLFVSRHLGGQQIVKQTDVYMLDSSLVVNVQPQNSIPSEPRALDTYPNPFNSQAFITYQLGKSAHLRLQVFDILGREVITLFDAFQYPGIYSVVWEAKLAASGVYLLRFAVDQQVQTRKMLYIR
ncbi:MAG: T9SS type A sorting domain-containing protein [Bacteroidota bacterium]